MPRFDVVTIGEGQLRYSVPVGHRLEDVSQLDVHACGTEANVAGLLARLGWRCGWVSALPNTALGRRVANQFKLAGLDLSAVVWSNSGRLATYYVEYAGPPRSTQVYYDRADSCFTKLSKEELDWGYVTDTHLLHLSGLTLPLSVSVCEVLLEAVRRAKSSGVLISFDVNYRRRLWPCEEARKVLLPILLEVDILFCSRGDAGAVLGIEGEPEEIIGQLSKLTAAKYLVVSLSSEGLVGSDRSKCFHQPACKVEIVDRIGAGDAMVAGVLHGFLRGDFFLGVRYGAITAALALSQFGDQVVTTAEEVNQLLNANSTLDIYR
jgi:2-dehydro-3-deoxygluconokinase